MSLDVVSMLTNIPTNLVLDLVRKHWNSIKQYTDIPMNEFVDAVDLTLNSTYFNFQDTYYKQINGLL